MSQLMFFEMLLSFEYGSTNQASEDLYLNRNTKLSDIMLFHQMSFEVRPLSKFLLTHMTWMLIHICVCNSDMHIEILLIIEWFGTYHTYKLFICCSIGYILSLERIMSLLHVSMKVVGGWTFFITKFTFRNFNLMFFLMLYFNEFIIQYFATNSTDSTPKW